MSGRPEIDIENFAAARQSGTLIDVREPVEYAAGHVSGAVLVPMGQLAARVQELDRSRPVYVICATGNRSLAMADLLHSGRLRRLVGRRRHHAWVRSNRPVEGDLR